MRRLPEVEDKRAFAAKKVREWMISEIDNVSIPKINAILGELSAGISKDRLLEIAKLSNELKPVLLLIPSTSLHSSFLLSYYHCTSTKLLIELSI